MLNGYDLSNNQGNIDNSIVPGDFVIIKATEGVGYTDPDCDANYQQSKGAGKKLGVYHFARPDGNDPISEANWFVSQIKGYIGEAILMLDYETSPMTVEWAKQWLDRVYELTLVRPIIYMTQSTANGMDWSTVWEDYSIIPASWGINAPINGYSVPTPAVSVNGNWTIAGWQYTSKGRLPGWGDFLDLDVFYGSRTTWDEYAARYTEPTPPVVVPVVTPPAPIPPVTLPVTPPVVTLPTQPVQVTPSDTQVLQNPPSLPIPPSSVQTSHVTVKQNYMESFAVIATNMAVTFTQVAFSAWAVNGFNPDKVVLAGAIGTGASAVWNIVLKPLLVRVGWLK